MNWLCRSIFMHTVREALWIGYGAVFLCTHVFFYFNESAVLVVTITITANIATYYSLILIILLCIFHFNLCMYWNMASVSYLYAWNYVISIMRFLCIWVYLFLGIWVFRILVDIFISQYCVSTVFYINNSCALLPLSIVTMITLIVWSINSSLHILTFLTHFWWNQ